MTALLSGTGIVKAFGPTRALDGADVAVGAGEVLAVMGPSGSGKSTLLHCLAGILPTDEGRVVYDGRDLTAMSDVERSALRRSDFGFIFQFGQLVPELTCRENVALPLRLDGAGRRDAERRAQEWLERLEVGELAGKRPGEVSGGQGQRVAVARALVTEPRVVFADEHTFFGLDDGDDAIEHARNAVAAADPLAVVATLDGCPVDPEFAVVRRGLYAAATLVLILVGASLLVGLLEQLRDRRRLLAALVAVGARRRTLSWSVLIQTAIPVALGVTLSIAAGVGLGAILLEIVSEPVHVDLGAIAVMAGAGAGVVVLVTVLTLPALWRLMRPEGLRTE